MVTGVEQLCVVSQATVRSNVKVKQVALFNADGTPNTLGTMTQAAARADSAAMTSAAASGGESPTEAEYNALRTDVVNLRTVVNDLLAKLRTAGIVASS